MAFCSFPVPGEQSTFLRTSARLIAGFCSFPVLGGQSAELVGARVSIERRTARCRLEFPVRVSSPVDWPEVELNSGSLLLL
jgi:hypothetical protein